MRVLLNSHIKIIIIIVLFLIMVGGSTIFDKVMSADIVDISLIRLTLSPTDTNPTEIKISGREPIIFTATLNSEALRVELDKTVFPGQNYIELLISDGEVIVWEKERRAFLKANSSKCQLLEKGLLCRVSLQHTNQGKDVVVITPVDDQATIQDIKVVNVTQHQTVWTTKFSVIVLIFAFIPLAIIIGLFKNPLIRTVLISIISITFIALLSLGLLLFLLSFLAFSYIILRLIISHNIGITLYVTMLVLSVLIIKLILPMTGVVFDVPINFIILPIGLSYLIARQIDLAIKIITRQAQVPTPLEFFTFNLYWPSLAAGPITQFTDMEFGKRYFSSWHDRVPGLTRIALGLFKKSLADIVFAIYVTQQYSDIMVYETADPTELLGFLFANMLFVYLDFSGYTDMVLGTSRLMGVSLPENFNNPLMRSNMRAFWQNWHMSLTSWVNRTVFMPLSFSMRHDNKVVRYVVPVFATTMTIGIWHGFQFVWILWAIHHAIGIFLTDFFLFIGRELGAKRYRFSSFITENGQRFGFLFVWMWLMMSYCFTLSSNPSIAIKNYVKIIYAPINFLF